MKTLLFTGASGFLGQNIMPALLMQYDKVATLGRNSVNDIQADLSADVPILPQRFSTVLHAAGLAHTIPSDERERQRFFDVNVGGTHNLCLALEKSGVPDCFIYISSVAVYGCDEGTMIDENHPLNGHTPYALSKIKAEKYLDKWCTDHGVTLTILRPALIVGKNAPGNLGAMTRAIRKGFYINISGGKARKSMLMADDIARILPLAEKRGGIYNLCDSSHPSFSDISALISRQMNKCKPLSVPNILSKLRAWCGDISGGKLPIDSRRLAKMTATLTFSNLKATQELGWQPLDVLTHFKP